MAFGFILSLVAGMGAMYGMLAAVDSALDLLGPWRPYFFPAVCSTIFSLAACIWLNGPHDEGDDPPPDKTYQYYSYDEMADWYQAKAIYHEDRRAFFQEKANWQRALQREYEESRFDDTPR